jgi:hypothetical protein
MPGAYPRRRSRAAVLSNLRRPRRCTRSSSPRILMFPEPGLALAALKHIRGTAARRRQASVFAFRTFRAFPAKTLYPRAQRPHRRSMNHAGTVAVRCIRGAGGWMTARSIALLLTISLAFGACQSSKGASRTSVEPEDSSAASIVNFRLETAAGRDNGVKSSDTGFPELARRSDRHCHGDTREPLQSRGRDGHGTHIRLSGG